MASYVLKELAMETNVIQRQQLIEYIQSFQLTMEQRKQLQDEIARTLLLTGVVGRPRGSSHVSVSEAS
jgi:hypothetical protein